MFRLLFAIVSKWYSLFLYVVGYFNNTSRDNPVIGIEITHEPKFGVYRALFLHVYTNCYMAQVKHSFANISVHWYKEVAASKRWRSHYYYYYYYYYYYCYYYKRQN